MKTVQMMSWIKTSLLVGAVAGLGACGTNNTPVPVNPYAAVPQAPTYVAPTWNNIPANQQTGNFDFVHQYLIPNLQTSWGNMTIPTAITITPTAVAGVASTAVITIPAGTYTWEDMYTKYILVMANSCGCFVATTGNQPANTTQVGGFVNMNFGTFDAVFSANYNNWNVAQVVFPQRGNYQTNFYVVFNSLVSANYEYYTSFYAPQYGFQPTVGYWPGYSVYGNGSGSGTSIGGIFSYDRNNGFSANIAGFFGRR